MEIEHGYETLVVAIVLILALPRDRAGGRRPCRRNLRDSCVSAIVQGRKPGRAGFSSSGASAQLSAGGLRRPQTAS